MTGYQSKRAAAQDKLVVTDIDGHVVRDARKPKKAQPAQEPWPEEPLGHMAGGVQSAQKPVAWPCVIAKANFEQNTITLEMQCSNYKVGVGQHWLYTTPPQETI